MPTIKYCSAFNTHAHTFNIIYKDMKKYYKTKPTALKAKDLMIKSGKLGIRVFKMPKGSKKAGMYAVCTELEYLNTY